MSKHHFWQEAERVLQQIIEESCDRTWGVSD